MTRQSSGACAGEGPRNANPVYSMREAAVTEQRDGLASTPPFGKPPVRNLAISGVALADLSIMSMVIADTAMNTRSRLCSSSNEMSISGLTKPRAQTAAGIGAAGSLRIDSGFLTNREYLPLSRIVRSMVHQRGRPVPLTCLTDGGYSACRTASQGTRLRRTSVNCLVCSVPSTRRRRRRGCRSFELWSPGWCRCCLPARCELTFGGAL